MLSSLYLALGTLCLGLWFLDLGLRNKALSTKYQAQKTKDPSPKKPFLPISVCRSRVRVGVAGHDF